MWYLLEKAMAETSDMTEHEWLEKARAWGALYVSVYSPEDVTPYLHVFVYHVGFFLEKYPKEKEAKKRGRRGRRGRSRYLLKQEQAN